MPRKRRVAGTRAAWMQRIRQNAQATQQAAIARQAGGFVPAVQPLQAATQQHTAATTPTPPPPPASSLPPPVAPTPQIQVPAIVPTVPQVAKQTKQKQYKAYGVAGGQVGPALPPGGKKALVQGGPSNKLARAQNAYLSRADVQKRMAEREQRKDRLQALGIGQNLTSGIQALPERVGGTLESTPTPFGIALPLLLLMLLYLILIPVNGKSRLEWFWLTVIKQAYVTQAAIQQGTVTQPIVSGTGSGGTVPPNTQQMNGGLVVRTSDGMYMYSGDDF